MFGHHKALWMGEMCLPIFRPCMCGCSCARIFIQSAWSNLFYVKIIYLDPALVHCYYLDDVAFLMIFSSNASIHFLSACLPHFFFLSYLELYYKLTSHSFFKHFVCYGRAPAIRYSLCDFRWYSFVCIRGLVNKFPD